MNSADSRDMVGSSDSRAAMASELIRWFSSYPHAIVAFSGGVDSAVVAYAAQAALGEAAFAVTGIGPAVSQRERQDAERVAERLGIQHVWLETQEIEDPDYQANLGRRCYYCKQHLYRSLQQWGMHRGWRYLFSGTNRDDLGDYRPGLQAAAEFQVLAPLVELDIGKQQVRQLAEYWSIPIADKPASPCLASRVAPGVRVDPKKLKAIELGKLGFENKASPMFGYAGWLEISFVLKCRSQKSNVSFNWGLRPSRINCKGSRLLVW